MPKVRVCTVVGCCLPAVVHKNAAAAVDDGCGGLLHPRRSHPPPPPRPNPPAGCAFVGLCSHNHCLALMLVHCCFRPSQNGQFRHRAGKAAALQWWAHDGKEECHHRHPNHIAQQLGQAVGRSQTVSQSGHPMGERWWI